MWEIDKKTVRLVESGQQTLHTTQNMSNNTARVMCATNLKTMEKLQANRNIKCHPKNNSSNNEIINNLPLITTI